jgi:hypothetical protein
MTPTRIREALHDVRDSVAVPPPDELAFRQHVRRARRSRTTRRTLVAAAAVAAVGVGPALWSARPAGSPADGMQPASPPSPTAVRLFPVSLDGRLRTVLPDGAGHSSHQRVEEVLGSGPAGVVVISRDSHLLLMPLLQSGQPGVPRDLGDGRPVQRAWLDKSGQYVGFVDLADTLHVRAVGSDRDLASDALTPDDMFLAMDGEHWLTERADAVTLRSAAGAVELTADEPAMSAEVAGRTVAYESRDAVDFFDSTDGERGARAKGLGVGSLSPDGRRYAGAPGESERDAGAGAGWYLVDTRTGERHVFAGRPRDAVAQSMTWQDDDRFLVLGTSPRQPGNRIVWDCSVAIGECVERYDDPGDSLQIPTR